MLIYIKIQSGERIQLNVDSDDNIECIKNQIEEVQGIPVNMQRLLFKGRQLNDENLLKDYSIEENAILNLILRLCGGKPVLYLYPPNPTNVNVSIELTGKMTCLYPKPKAIQTDNPNTERYEWEVEANQNSEIKFNGRKYSYLFWEGEAAFEYDFRQGFIVKGSESSEFLEKVLDRMGLKENEINEFIVYWLPYLERKPYNLISFQFKNYTEIAKLEIEPKPDHLIRIFMIFKPLNTIDDVNVEEQVLPEIKRNELHGFVAVEWGGTSVEFSSRNLEIH